MHIQGWNKWIHILYNKRYLVNHMTWKRERYSNSTTTTTSTKITRQLSAAAVQCFTGLYKSWGTGCFPIILLLWRTHQISEKFLFPLYIFTSSPPFFLPFLHIKIVSNVLPFHLQPSILSYSFLMHTVYQKAIQWWKKFISTLRPIVALLMTPLRMLMSVHLHICPQLVPERLDKFYSYLLFKTLSIIGQCPANTDILSRIGALSFFSCHTLGCHGNNSFRQQCIILLLP